MVIFMRQTLPMLKNYLKTAWRNLLRNKAHTAINLTGLSVGLTCGLLILLWVQSELAVDSYHVNGPELPQVRMKGHIPGLSRWGIRRRK